MNAENLAKGTILVVDDNPTNIDVLLVHLEDNGFRVLVARDGASAIERAKFAKPDLILLDVRMPGIDGFETCRRLKADNQTQEIPVIFMTALAETTNKIRGFNVGAVDYVTKPIETDEVLARVSTHLTLRRVQNQLTEANERLEQRVAERTVKLAEANTDLKDANAKLTDALSEVERLRNQLQAENVYLQEEIAVSGNFEEIIGQSSAMRNTLDQVELVAPTDSTVLIVGETGTGKELIARAVHNQSLRKNRSLVKVNCGAISAGLVESELFGHERGAFTGATQRRAGRFELADGGTIFLDEVGELPPDTQVKLLRVLQEGEFERVGSSQPIRVDVRVIAATNRDLATAVENGDFRQDLFYRLSVFPLEVPPLSQRKEDIPLLANFFLTKFTQRLGKSLLGISQESISRLMNYSWPGNVRELQNVIERAVILAKGPTLQTDKLLSLQTEDGDSPASQSQAQHIQTSPPTPSPPPAFTTLEAVERNHILNILEQTHWVIEGKQGAALILDLHPSTLRFRMKKLGIQKPERIMGIR